MYIPYNSRLEYHKSIFGAVKTDQTVTFRIILPRDFCCHAAKLVIKKAEDELLQRLQKSGIKTAVASSKPQAELEKIINSSELHKYIDCIVGADMNYKDSDKAAIVGSAIEKVGVADKSRILMVGDRKFDIVGAHKIGIPCAAVLFGYGTREEFEEYKADYIVSRCTEIAEIVFEGKNI